MATQTYPVPPNAVTGIENVAGSQINPLTEESFQSFLSTIILNHVRDPNNTRTAPFFDNEIYSGAFTKFSDWSSAAIVFVSDQEPVSAMIEWSDDGIVPVTDSLTPTSPIPYKLDAGVYVGVLPVNTPFHSHARVVMDYTGLTNAISGVFTLLSQDPLPATILGLDAEIPSFALGSITRSILGGRKLDGLLQPTNEFENVALTKDNALITASPGTLLFGYSTPTDPPLPSGATPSINPILNTEANSLDSGWLPSASYPGGQELVAIADVAGMDFYLMNASDELGNNITGNTFPFLTTVTPGEPIVLSAPMFGKRYFRLVAVNRSGTTANQLTVSSFGNQVPTPPFYSGIDQPFFTFTPAAAQKAAMYGRVPGTNLMKLMEITTQGFLNVANQDFLREVSLGRVGGHSIVEIQGQSDAVGTTFEDVWFVTGVLTQPTVADTVDFSSTSILDISAGTGVQTITVTGLDSNYDPIEEVINLNGLTPVTTVNSYIRVFRIDGTAGVLGESAGIITGIHADTALPIIRMKSGVLNSSKTHYTIPSGKVGILVEEEVNAGAGDDADFRLQVKSFGTASFRTVRQQAVSGGAVSRVVTATKSVFQSKSDIRWQSRVVPVGITRAVVNYSLLLVDEELV